MFERLQRVAILGLAAGLASGLTLGGCTAESDPGHDDDAAEHRDGDGGGHDGDGADHDGSEHDMGGEDHGAASAREIGTVRIGTSMMSVAIGGDVEPNAVLNVDVTVIDGPVPPSIRLWIGNEAGDGAIKSRAAGHDDHFHGSAEAPAVLTDDALLWIEVESLDGSGGTASLPLG